ncbi:MAG: ferredoxin [Bacillota bacterium]
MARAKVDPELCIGCGLCADICPDVFEMDDTEGKAFVKDNADCAEAGCCEEAAESCPTAAIEVE